MTQARRCRDLYLTSRETLEFDLAGLLSGGTGLVPCQHWVALAPHLGSEIPISEELARAVLRISPSSWQPLEHIEAEIGVDATRALREMGLIVCDDDSGAARKDALLRGQFWHPVSGLAHAFGRWSGVGPDEAQRQIRNPVIAAFVDEHGPPPPHFHQRADVRSRHELPAVPTSPFAALCERRVTCRNFDTGYVLPMEALAALLHRVFGVQGEEALASDTVALKKNSPSGGALHSIEAYLVVQRVAGLEPGWYHYHVGRHGLDLVSAFVDAAEARDNALAVLAGQYWFADAPVQVVLTSRFARAFWKYRNHAKIYRAVLLEAGHLSQNLYLAATELGLGAFITAAVNEIEVERMLALEPMQEGVIAVCGIGIRAPVREIVEFDPNGKVWFGGTP